MIVIDKTASIAEEICFVNEHEARPLSTMHLVSHTMITSTLLSQEKTAID